MMKQAMAAAMLMAVVAAPVRADRPVGFLPAEQLPKNVTLHAVGKLQKDLHVPGVEVAPGDAAATKVIEEKEPKAPSHVYTLVGKVKYEDVDEPAYLEMWSHFGGNAYFSRTLGEAGPMMKFKGTHKWRDVALPFKSKPGMLPDKLVVNVVLPSKGKIWLTELRLQELKSDAGSAQVGAWWSGHAAGWVGGIGGSVVGILGAVIGTLCGIGVGRQICLAVCYLVIGVGAAAVIAGIAALIMGQPYHVFYPLLLGGGIGAGVIGFNLPRIRKRYDELELRRMSAMDA